MRTCVITKEKCEKKDLIRVVRLTNEEVVVDLSGKQNGRGAYLKKDKEVFAKARKSKVLDRVLEAKTEDSLYDELDNLLN